MERSMLYDPIRRLRMLLAFMAVLVAGAMQAHAQPFQTVHGGRCLEAGYKGVTLVAGCASGGFISVGISYTPVGTTASCPSTSDVYVVRTTTAGATIWERTYNIFGTVGASSDSASSVKETPDGFIITGTTSDPTTTKDNIFLLKIRCDGTIVWAKTYKSGSSSQEGGRDIIITKHGDGINNFMGDYVIAGWSDSSGIGTNIDGFIMRTDTAGNIRWSKSYDPGTGGNEQFFGVIETQKGDTGDIVAAGGTTSFAGLAEQGYVVRVNGNTGAIGVSPQGAAHFGGAGSERFFSVKELTRGILGTQAANLVYVGYTRANGAAIGQEDLYVVKTTPSPCIKLASRVIGDPNRDMAYDVVEILNGSDKLITGQTKVVGLGDLAVVGATNHNSVGGIFTVLTDMFLLPLKVTTLAPAGGGFLYGDGVINGTNAANDGASSVTEIPASVGNGFVICGYTQSNLEAASPADPQDLYLVRTDPPNANDGCYLGWTPSFNADSAWAAGCDTPDVRTVVTGYVQTATLLQPTWRDLVCSCPTCKRVIEQGQLGDELSSPDGATIVSYPNPVKRGAELTIDYHTHHTGLADVVVTDALGKTVHQMKVAMNGEPIQITLSTGGWSAGNYMVAVTDGVSTRSVRVVVE